MVEETDLCWPCCPRILATCLDLGLEILGGLGAECSRLEIRKQSTFYIFSGLFRVYFIGTKGFCGSKFLFTNFFPSTEVCEL